MGLADRIRKLRRKPLRWKTRPELLLCPQIPKPMHGLAPRVVLGSIWWDEERKKAYRSTAYHCQACGIHKSSARFRQWLEGHELYSVDYLLGRMYYLGTVPLCHCCHNYIHIGRLNALLNNGEVSHAKYREIIQHGDRVLAQAGLCRPLPYGGPMADWDDWRLVLNGKEYRPLLSKAEWLQNHVSES